MWIYEWRQYVIQNTTHTKRHVQSSSKPFSKQLASGFVSQNVNWQKKPTCGKLQLLKFITILSIHLFAVFNQTLQLCLARFY